MERFWAPWRLEYYRDKENNEGCVFCVGDEESKDRERYILRRGEHSFIMLNKYPFVGAHLLIIPYRHLQDVAELSADEAAEIHQFTVMASQIMRQSLRADGFNIGVNLGADGGAGICEHYHQHLVPRWRGDTNFMPLLAEVRVLPQHLTETYDLLQPLLQKASLPS